MVVKMYEYMDGEGLPLAATLCAATLSSGDTPQRPASLHQAKQHLAARRTIAATGDHHSPENVRPSSKRPQPLALSRPGDRLKPLDDAPHL